MKAVIVAGGRGERLKPFTENIPKPMVEVGNKTILEYTIEVLKSGGINEIIIALCYLPEVITSYFGDGSKFGVKIKYTYETPDQPLGTAGAVRESKKYIDDDFIVTYADILRELDVNKMIDIHRQSNSMATLNIYKEFEKIPRSMLEIDNVGRLTRFVEHPQVTNSNGSFVWCNGSFYIFKPEIFKYIGESEKVDFSADIFPRLIADKEKIMTFKSDGYFLNIGTIEKLEMARKNFPV